MTVTAKLYRSTYGTWFMVLTPATGRPETMLPIANVATVERLKREGYPVEYSTITPINQIDGLKPQAG